MKKDLPAQDQANLVTAYGPSITGPPAHHPPAFGPQVIDAGEGRTVQNKERKNQQKRGRKTEKEEQRGGGPKLCDAPQEEEDWLYRNPAILAASTTPISGKLISSFVLLALPFMFWSRLFDPIS